MELEGQGKGAIVARLTPYWQIVAVGLLVLLVGCNLLFKPPVTSSVHLTLGNPSNATVSLLNSDKQASQKVCLADCSD